MTFLSAEALTRVAAAADGFFLIPSGPATDTSVTSSASANTYGSWAEMEASTSAAIYLLGCIINSATGSNPGYAQIDIGTGAAASESSIGEWKVEGNDSASEDFVADGQILFPFPIAIPASTRIACRMADDVASGLAYAITLFAINQADVEGVAA